MSVALELSSVSNLYIIMRCRDRF